MRRWNARRRRVPTPWRSARERRRQCIGARRDQATLGQQAGNEPRRRDIERIVRRDGAFRYDPYGLDPPVGGHSRQVRHLFGSAFFDRNLGDAVARRKIDRRRGQRDIERNAGVVRGKRFQVSPDLVADVALAGGAVDADDHEVHLAVLHQVAAGVVGDHRARHAVLLQFPGGERGALVARARLIDIDVDRNPAVIRRINRRRGGADIDRRQPAGIAVGQHVDPGAVLAGGGGFDQFDADLPDRRVDGDVLVGDLLRARISRSDALAARAIADGLGHLVERPPQVDRGRTGRGKSGAGAVEGLIGGIGVQRQAHAIGGGGADERRAAHHHALDRPCGLIERGQPRADEPVRQPGLIDHADRPAIGLEPNGAPRLSVNFHDNDPDERCVRRCGPIEHIAPDVRTDRILIGVFRPSRRLRPSALSRLPLAAVFRSTVLPGSLHSDSLRACGRLDRQAQAPVAQLDRALPSEGKGQRFESPRARQISMT